MKNLLLVLLTISLLFGSCKKDDDVDSKTSNTWIKTFGGTGFEEGWSVQQTTDGGYIITGITNSSGNGSNDIYLIKTDGNGIEQWNKTFGGTGVDWGYSVQQTTDGGYVVSGDKNFGSGNKDVFLIKTDSDGLEQWTKTFGGTDLDSGNSVQQTTDGGYVITGITYSFGNGYGDTYLIKTDGNGTEQWTKTFGGGMSDNGNSVQQTTDGGYIITGITNFGNNGDVYLIKTDENGDSLWTKTFGGTGSDFGKSVQQTTDGGYIITGHTSSFGNGKDDVYLIKTDENGVEQWTKTFGGIEYDSGNSVQQTTDGGYIITGKSESVGNVISDLYLIKTDGNGTEQWTKTFGGTEWDVGYSVQQTSDGGYVVSGSTTSYGSGGGDLYLIKTDENGDVIP